MSNLSRRGLIGTLFGSAAVLDVEKLLWVPGAKVISIPRPVVIAPGNRFLTFDEVSSELLRILEKQLRFQG